LYFFIVCTVLVLVNYYTHIIGVFCESAKEKEKYFSTGKVQPNTSGAGQARDKRGESGRGTSGQGGRDSKSQKRKYEKRGKRNRQK